MVPRLQSCPCGLSEAVSPVLPPPELCIPDLDRLHDTEVGEEGVLRAESEYVRLIDVEFDITKCHNRSWLTWFHGNITVREMD